MRDGLRGSRSEAPELPLVFDHYIEHLVVRLEWSPYVDIQVQK